MAELTAVEALRHQIYKDSNYLLRSKCGALQAKCEDHERRIKALEDVIGEIAAKKRRKQQEEEKKRRDEEERVRRVEEEKVREAERKRKEEEEMRRRAIITDSKIMNDQQKINLTGYFADMRD